MRNQRSRVSLQHQWSPGWHAAFSGPGASAQLSIGSQGLQGSAGAMAMIMGASGSQPRGHGAWWGDSMAYGSSGALAALLVRRPTLPHHPFYTQLCPPPHISLLMQQHGIVSQLSSMAGIPLQHPLPDWNELSRLNELSAPRLMQQVDTSIPPSLVASPSDQRSGPQWLCGRPGDSRVDFRIVFAKRSWSGQLHPRAHERMSVVDSVGQEVHSHFPFGPGVMRSIPRKDQAAMHRPYWGIQLIVNLTAVVEIGQLGIFSQHFDMVSRGTVLTVGQLRQWAGQTRLEESQTREEECVQFQLVEPGDPRLVDDCQQPLASVWTCGQWPVTACCWQGVPLPCEMGSYGNMVEAAANGQLLTAREWEALGIYLD